MVYRRLIQRYNFKLYQYIYLDEQFFITVQVVIVIHFKIDLESFLVFFYHVYLISIMYNETF